MFRTDQVICFEEHILCHALSVRCGTLPMFSFGISSVWLLSERVSMLTKLLRVSLMLGNVLILRMSYRSEGSSRISVGEMGSEIGV